MAFRHGFFTEVYALFPPAEWLYYYKVPRHIDSEPHLAHHPGCSLPA